MRARRRPVVIALRREAVYGAIVVLALFTAAEVVLRVRHAITDARRGARPYSIRSVTRDGLPYADDDGQLDLRLEPFVVYGHRPSQRTPAVSINGDGFRGAAWNRDKPAGTRRVVVLGGSAAFGVGASGDAAVFTAKLEARLDERARAHGGRVEVWNAAAVGYDSSQELILLATRLVHLAPDVVVCFDGWNDFNASALMPEGQLGLVHPKFSEIDVLLGRSSQPVLELLRGLDVVRSLESGMRRRLRKLERKQVRDYGDYADRSATALPRYERNLRAMIRLARGFGAVAVDAPQPELCLRRDPPPRELAMRRGKEDDGYTAYAAAVYPRFVAAARAIAASEGAPLADCTTAFDGLAEPFFTDCVHFDDRGHEVIAAQLEVTIAPLLEPRAER